MSSGHPNVNDAGAITTCESGSPKHSTPQRSHGARTLRTITPHAKHLHDPSFRRRPFPGPEVPTGHHSARPWRLAVKAAERAKRACLDREQGVLGRGDDGGQERASAASSNFVASEASWASEASSGSLRQAKRRPSGPPSPHLVRGCDFSAGPSFRRVRHFRTRSLLLLLQRDASLLNDIHPGSWVIHAEAIPRPGLWLHDEGFTGIALGRHRAADALSQ